MTTKAETKSKTFDSSFTDGIVLLLAAVILGWVWAYVDLVATLFFVEMLSGGRILNKFVKAILVTIWSLLELTWAASPKVRENPWASRFIIGVMVADFATDLFYVKMWVMGFITSTAGQQVLAAFGLPTGNSTVHTIIWIVAGGIATFAPQLLMIEFTKLSVEHLYNAATNKNLSSNTNWSRVADIGIFALALGIGLWVVLTRTVT